MIRLSEAYARLELSFRVEPRHVREAYRLLSCSILKLEKPNIELNAEEEEEVRREIWKMNIRDEIWVIFIQCRMRTRRRRRTKRRPSP
jgi:DNA replicative helicase MCM subunit Mcm2 (Cdc46/Mcm family)